MELEKAYQNIYLKSKKVKKKKELTMDEEIENNINLSIKKSKISPLSKYIPLAININFSF